MIAALKGLVLRMVRVPPEPTPPPGDPDAIRVFRASPRYFRYRLLGWAWGQLAALLGLVLGLLFLGEISGPDSGLLGTLIGIGEAFAWIAFLAQIPTTLAALRLDYELRWYMLSDRALRIREGILTVREKTITFANIQQVSVRQGPVQRLLGVADIEVRTAGGGGSSEGDDSGGDMHRGRIRGVSDPEEIRELLRARMRAQRDAGLGDPDDSGAVTLTSGRSASRRLGPGHAPALAPAGELLDEVRALRRALTD